MEYSDLFTQQNDNTRVNPSHLANSYTFPQEVIEFAKFYPNLPMDQIAQKYYEYQSKKQYLDQKKEKTPYDKQQSAIKQKQVEVQEKEIKTAENEQKALQFANGIMKFISPSNYVELISGKDLNAGQEFAADILLDPTSYASFGLLPFVKTFSKEGIEKAGQQLLKNGLKYATSASEIQNIHNILSNIRNTEWFDQIVKSYGKDYAEAVVKNFEKNPNQLMSFIFSKDKSGNSFDALEEILKYNQSRDIMSKIQGDLDQGKGVISGSAAVLNEGSIKRPSAAFHDIDSYILAPDYTTYDLMDRVDGSQDLSILTNKKLLRELPIFESLPGMTSKTSRRGQNNPSLIKRFIPFEKDAILEGRGLIQGFYEGYPLDFFPSVTTFPLTSGGIHPSGFVSHEMPFYYKRLWQRPKDVKDLQDFKRWSQQNPIINIDNGTTQFSPLSFGNGLINTEGLPVIYPVQLYPGSQYYVPSMMNWKGQLRNPLSNNLGLDEFIFKKGGKINVNNKFKRNK